MDCVPVVMCSGSVSLCEGLLPISPYCLDTYTCTYKTIVTAMQSMIFLWLKIDHGAWSVIMFSLY